MHPLAVGPAPDILTGCDNRTAQLADLSRGVRLVAAPRGAVLVLVTHSVFQPRAAQIFQHSLFNFAASEIWRGCHVCLLQVLQLLPACLSHHVSIRRRPRPTSGLAGANLQRSFRNGPYFVRMDEFRARRVVDALRDRGVDAHLLRGGVGQFGVRVSLPGGCEAEWDTDGTAGLEAQVMRDGMLVGYVPQIEGSEDFDEARIVDAIARTDYAQPVARQRTVAPAPGPALTREGGVFRRFLDGFRYR